MAGKEKTASVFESMLAYVRSFDTNKLNDILTDASSEPLLAAGGFGICFIIGLLFKKYFKFFFSCLAVSIVAIKVMEYNNLLKIDWPALYTFLGFQANTDLHIMINHLFDWIKINVIVFLACLSGFLIGYKLG